MLCRSAIWRKFWLEKINYFMTITILVLSIALFLFKTQLTSIGLSVPHRKFITSPIRAQQVNAIYRFVAMVY
jgi:hypothetical protein